MKRILVVLVVLSVSCSGLSSKPAQTVIDCVKADSTQIEALAADLSALVFGGSPDWGAIFDHAKDAGAQVGGCVLSQLVQKYVAQKKPLNHGGDNAAARKALERFRSDVAGGATFHTPAGDL